MPGLCGILDAARHTELAARLDVMLDVMRHHAWYAESRYIGEADGLALGRISLGFVNAARQPAVSEVDDLVVMMEGELYDTVALRTGLEAAGHRFAGDSHAEILLAGFRRDRQRFLRDLHGSFVAAIWDGQARQLILVNDRFGIRPLYYAHPQGKLLFASSIQALVRDEDVSTSPHLPGLAQFFSFGQYLNEDTSLAEVRVIPGAAWVTYHVDDDRLTVGQYLQLAEEVSAPPDTSQELLKRLDAAFTAAVARRRQGGHALGLALSGGLDARMILACLDNPAERVKTISYGIEGSLDHRCATQLAQLAGCSHANHLLDAGFLSQFEQHLEQMVRLTDGQYLSQCIILPTLPVYRQLGIQVLMRGHAGELMHMRKAYAYSLDRKAFQIRDDAALDRWLSAHLQGYMLSAVDGSVLRGVSAEDVQQMASASLRDALSPAAAFLPPLQRIWYLFVTQRLRRETALSLAKFGSMVEVRVPYLDNDLISLLLSAPPEMKLGETIQSYILAQHRPEFLQVVNSNTGTHIGAGDFARKFSTLKMRVFAKLGVRGYQPYERLGLWLRRELRPLVQEILLSDACLDRGVFEPDTVRTVVRQHDAAQRNHTYLLMAMMIYELGQRRLFPPGDAPDDLLNEQESART